MNDDTFVIKADVDNEQANRLLNGIKDELLQNGVPSQNEEETETLEEWLKEDSRLERLQEQFIQKRTEEFLKMLETAKEEDDVKTLFCDKHKEEFRAFCERAFKKG